MISILVPAYNSERYVAECLSSALRQTFRDFEVLLIDDGSRDATCQIGYEFMKRDPRIQVLSQSHKGVSAARNAGLDMARGDVIFFMDSDDTVVPDTLEALMNQMVSQRADMAFGQYGRTENGFHGSKEWEKGERAWFRLDEREAADLFSQNNRLFGGIGGKLIRKESIGKLRFEEGLSLGEDTWFLYSLMEKGVSAVYTTDAMYYYRKHKGGSWALRFTLEGILASGAVFKRMERMEQNYGRMEHARFWEGEYVRILKRAMDCLPREELYQMRNAVIQEMKNPYFRQRPWRIKGTVLLAFFCYPLYCWGKGWKRTIKRLWGGENDKTVS